jgi:hypothetical protein
MNIRNLLMASALVAVAGISAGAVAAEQEAVMVKPSWNGMNDGAPPVLEQRNPDVATSGMSESEAQRMGASESDLAEVNRRASRSKEEIMNEQTDEQVEWMRKHNKEIYGTDEGPFTELEKQEQMAIDAKKKVAVYGMTYQEREAMLQAEAEAAAENGMKPSAEAAQQEKPGGGYIYNRKRTSDAPPRLFNNVTR